MGRVERTNRKVLGCEDGRILRGHISSNLVSHSFILSVMYSHGEGGEWSE